MMVKRRSPSNIMESPPGPETTVDGKRYLYFGGTSYYGLHANPEMIQAGIDAWRRQGTNTATIRSGIGTSPAHVDVETAVAAFFGCEDAVYVASGYLSDAAGLQALHTGGDFDVIFIDESAHYSLTDAARLTDATLHTFAHRDADSLRQKLHEKLKPGQSPLVLSDGLFPVVGEFAPVPDYIDVLSDTGGHIWLDDAHPAGILGPHGRGTSDHFGIDDDRVYSCGTLAKAFGGFGGFIAGSESFIDKVRKSPVYLGASAPPSPIAATTAEGLRLVADNPQWRERLWENARHLKRGLNQLGFGVRKDSIPVAAFTLGDRRQMEKIVDQLLQRGIVIQLVDYPGATAEGMLRIVVFSTHTHRQIDRLIDELGSLL